MSSTIKKALFFIFILLIPFQDSALQGTTLGFLGATPAFLPLIIIIAIVIIETFIKRKLKINNRQLLISTFIGCYVLLITSIYLLVFGIQSHGTNLVIKSINLLILTILFLFPIFCIDYKNTYSLRLCIFIAFFITVSGVFFFDVLNLGSDNSIVHYHINSNMRPRGFTLESSWLSAMIITLSLLSAHFSNTNSKKMFFITIMLATLLFSGSKGGIIILMTLFYLMLLFHSRFNFLIKLLILILGSVILYLVFDFFSDIFVMQITEYTSIVTRLGLAITSIIILAHNPLGVGFSGFLPAIDKFAPIAINYLNQIINLDLNFNEINSYVGASVAADISTKTFLLDYSIFFGVPFLICFFIFNYKLLVKLKEQKKICLFMAVAYCCIALCTYINGLGFYNISIVYGVAYYDVYRKKSISSCT
jgi:hypothetical protein